MKDGIAVLLSLLISFSVIMIPLGMWPTMPEFWVTPWLYGLPVLVVAPVYLALFHRLRRRGRWMLPILGFALSPIPFLLLVLATDALRGDLLASHPSSYYAPWNSVFTIWYAAFGIILGAWFAWKGREEPI